MATSVKRRRLRDWASSIFGHAATGRTGLPARPYRPRLEALEDRTVPTTTLFLDFGRGLGMGNTMSTTVGAFRDIDGAGIGGDGTGSDMTGVGMSSGDSLDFSPLSYDFDGNSVINNADIDAFAAAVAPIVQRAMEPFDIDVVVVTTTNDVSDAVTLMSANDGDAGGQFDAYVFIYHVRSDAFSGGSVGDNTGLFGIAAADDLFRQQGNDQDECVLAFADVTFGLVTGTPGSAQFNSDLAHDVAFTVSHEAFHTFTFIHTNSLTASGDIISVPPGLMVNPHMVTRFDLAHDNAVAEPNNYLLAANDADIGLRDANNNGRPDLGYVTGTGASDVITLTSGAGGVINVQVQAFSDAAHTAIIATETYTIDPATEADAILIDGGINRDDIIIDGRINRTIRVRGGIGLDGVSGEVDRLHVTGQGLSVRYAPAMASTGNSGTYTITGGATVQFSEVEALQLSNFASYTLVTPGAVDNLTLSSATGFGGEQAFILAGTSGGSAFVNPVAFNIGTIIVDAASNDGAGAADTILVNQVIRGAGTVQVNTGGGADTMTVDFSGGALFASGGVTFNAGAGNDLLAVNNGSFANIVHTTTAGAGGQAGNATFNGSQPLSYGGLETFNDRTTATNFIYAGSNQNDSFRFQTTAVNLGTPTLQFNQGPGSTAVNFANKTNLFFVGGGGSDSLEDGNGLGHTWNITGAFSGRVPYTININFQAIEILIGGVGRDVFHLSGAAQIGRVNGGGGINWLDYSGVAAGVNVNLARRFGSRISGGFSGIQNLIGSGSGGDRLVGDSAGSIVVGRRDRNRINSGGGRNLLIGGFGRTSITGGRGEDILIAGRTIYDGDYDALEAILAAWKGPGSYAARVAALRAGPTRLVVGQTVFLHPGLNGGRGPRYGVRAGALYDSVTAGDAGQDWFFVANAKNISDRKQSERVN